MLTGVRQGCLLSPTVTRFAKISAKTGLRISKSNTKVTRVMTRNVDNVKLDGKAIDEVEDFTCIPWQQHQQEWWEHTGKDWEGRQELLLQY